MSRIVSRKLNLYLSIDSWDNKNQNFHKDNREFLKNATYWTISNRNFIVFLLLRNSCLNTRLKWKWENTKNKLTGYQDKISRQDWKSNNSMLISKEKINKIAKKSRNIWLIKICIKLPTHLRSTLQKNSLNIVNLF